MKFIEFDIGTELVCPVCNKTFKFSEDSKFKVNKKYVCTWKCFLDKVYNRVPNIDTSVKDETVAEPKNTPETKPKIDTKIIKKVIDINKVTKMSLF